MYHFRFTPENKLRYTQNIMYLLKVSERPVIPMAEEIVETSTLGDGTTSYRHTGVYQDRKIPIKCNFVLNSKKEYLDRIYKIQQYFNGNKGILELTSDDREHYWKVKNVTFDIDSRDFGRGSEFTITFICEPYRYVNKYSRPYNIVSGKKVELANYYETAYPIYRLYNTSMNAKNITINCNGNNFTITNPFNGTSDISYVEINTENSYMKTYYKNGTYKYDTLKTSGSFGGLKFNYGSNNVLITTDIGAIRAEIIRNYREK